MIDIEIRRMLPSEGKIVAEVCSYAYQNDPPLVAIYQSNREEARKNLKESLIEVYTNRPHETFVAVHKGRIVGSIRSQPCTGLFYSGLSYSEGEYDYIISHKLEELSIEQREKWWFKTCESHDLVIPHSHIGPFAVLPEFQGKGVGSLLMEDYLSILKGVPSYLETFTAENLRFYEKRGYKLVEVDDVLGLKGYWLRRD